MTYAYRLGNHKLISDIELPELMPWDGDAGSGSVLRFRVGENDTQDAHQRYVVPGQNQITIADGAQVTIRQLQGDDIADTRAMLMGPVQAVLWHQRGLLPLHASAVSVGDKAIAIAGQSGAGKSTLAAALASKGYPVLADDITIFDPDRCEILTGQRRLRLWRSALERLGLSVDGLSRAMSRTEKYVWKTEEHPIPERTRLSHVILLVRRSQNDIEIKKVKGAQATFALLEVVHMLSPAHELGLGSAVFSSVTRLQTSGVSVLRLLMPNDLRRIDDVAKELLAYING